MKRMLAFIIFFVLICFDSNCIADDLFAETYSFPEKYPGYVFHATNYSPVLRSFNEDEIILSDPFHGTLAYPVNHEDIRLYEGKLVIRIDDSEIMFSEDQTCIVIPSKKYPENKEVFYGEWKVTGIGINGSYISAEEFGVDGVAEIDYNSFHLHLAENDFVKEISAQIDSEMKYDSLCFIHNDKLYTISLRDDDTLLVFTGFADFFLTLEKYD